MNEVIQYLEQVLDVAMYNMPTLYRESINKDNDEKSQSFNKMLLTEALTEVASLKVVIEMLKDELEWEQADDLDPPVSDIKERFARFKGYEHLPKDELLKLEEGALQRLNDIREALKGGV